MTDQSEASYVVADSLGGRLHAVGDKVATKVGFIIQHQKHVSIAEGGIVIWTGGMRDFIALIRDAARKDMGR